MRIIGYGASNNDTERYPDSIEVMPGPPDSIGLEIVGLSLEGCAKGAAMLRDNDRVTVWLNLPPDEATVLRNALNERLGMEDN